MSASDLTPNQTKKLNQLNQKAKTSSLSSTELAQWNKLKQIRDRQPNQNQGGQQHTVVNTNQGPIYIGVASNSDLEQKGINFPTPPRAADPYATTGPQSFPMAAGSINKKPLYKTGYMNSKQFAHELGDMSPDAIYQYQQGLEQAGLLKKYQPGKMDTPTTKAFRNMIATANQTGSTWQSTFQDLIQTGTAAAAGVGKQAPDAFVSQLDDPATLKEAFQSAAQSIYGGNLPDSEVNAMVDSYHNIQTQRQQAAYTTGLAANAGGVQGSVTNVPSPGDFAAQQIKAQHPDQVAKVQFQGTLSDALKSLSTTGGGLM